MHRSTNLMIRLMIHLVVIVPLMTASRTLADPAGRLLLHTNQEDLVRHSNQEGGWQQLLSEPQPVLLPNPVTDPFAVDLGDLLPDPGHLHRVAAGERQGQQILEGHLHHPPVSLLHHFEPPQQLLQRSIAGLGAARCGAGKQQCGGEQ